MTCAVGMSSCRTPFSHVDARQGREAVTSPLPALRVEAYDTTPPSTKLDT
jgi:hypothetical protein